MTDRRRAPRYVLESHLAGDALPMQDVVVNSLSGSRLVVTSPSAYAPHEELMIHIATPHGVESHNAKLITSRPSAIAGTLGFRLELRIDNSASPSRDEPNS